MERQTPKQTERQHELKYTDTAEWLRQQFNGDNVKGAIDNGIFTGEVYLERMAADLREYIGAKFSVDTPANIEGSDPM